MHSNLTLKRLIKFSTRADEVAQKLDLTVVALSEDLGSNPGSHMAAHDSSHSSCSTLWVTGMHMCTDMHTRMCIK